MDTKPSETAAPVELHEGQLDELRGGIGLLVPAVQAAREAANTTSPATGGVNVAMGDGSVRFVADGIN